LSAPKARDSWATTRELAPQRIQGFRNDRLRHCSIRRCAWGIPVSALKEGIASGCLSQDVEPAGWAEKFRLTRHRSAPQPALREFEVSSPASARSSCVGRLLKGLSKKHLWTVHRFQQSIRRSSSSPALVPWHSQDSQGHRSAMSTITLRAEKEHGKTKIRR